MPAEPKFLLGDVWQKDGVTWRVVSVNEDTIGLSGPGPCRGMKYVHRDELLSKWIFIARNRPMLEEAVDGLTITIAGRPDRGKTTTARIIEEALREAGYVNVKVCDVDPITDKDRWWNRFQRTRTRPVIIKVKVAEGC